MSEPTLRPDTLAVRAGLARSGFEETAEAMYLTSGFVYDSAEAAEAAFAGESERFVYSRYGNPTTAMLEQRLAALEGAEACSATASGMSAVFTALAALLGAEVEVPTLAGTTVRLRIPAGTPNGRTFRVRGRGVPRSDGSRGDLLATVEIAVPESLDDDARHVVERLRDSLPQATPRPWEVK